MARILDRVLIGKSASGQAGFWASKPGVNVIAYAGNTFFDDMYGYNENFDWTLNEKFTYGFHEYVPTSVTGSGGRIKTTQDGTILFTSNANLSLVQRDSYKLGSYNRLQDGWTNFRLNGEFAVSLNATPNWSGVTNQGWLDWTTANHRRKDLSFVGKDYPVLEMRVRKPPKSDGSHWTMQELGPSLWDFGIIFHTSNSTVSYLTQSQNESANPYVIGNRKNLSVVRVGGTSPSWFHIITGTNLGVSASTLAQVTYSGEWRILEYDMKNAKLRVYDDATETLLNTYSLVGTSTTVGPKLWVEDTKIDNLFFRFHYGIGYRKYPLSSGSGAYYPDTALMFGSGVGDVVVAPSVDAEGNEVPGVYESGGDPFQTVGLDHSEPDTEIDYIRVKKLGVPIKFGNSINEKFAFSSDWESTGLVHQTGRVTVGNEYAWANGTSKHSGTSHPGSTSGRIDFPSCPIFLLFYFSVMIKIIQLFHFPAEIKNFHLLIVTCLQTQWFGIL